MIQRSGTFQLRCLRQAVLPPLSTWLSHIRSSSAPSKPGEANSLDAVLLEEVVTTKSSVLSQFEIEAVGGGRSVCDALPHSGPAGFAMG